MTSARPARFAGAAECPVVVGSWWPSRALTCARCGALRSYPTYLKPHTVATWLREARPDEEYILIVDSDMIFRQPLLPSTLGVQPGVAASQNQWYAVFEYHPIAMSLGIVYGVQGPYAI